MPSHCWWSMVHGLANGAAMRPRAGVGITVGVVVAVLVAAVATSAEASSSQATRSPAAAQPEAAVFHNWVALGDSYSSGEGSAPFDQGTDTNTNRCRRSALGWPRLLGAEHHLACSGATIQHLYEGQMAAPDDRGQIARLAALNQASAVDAVTVTIGGNDIPFAGVIGDCYLLPVCTLGGVNAQIDGVAQRLADTNGNGVYRDIQNAAPAAEVIVVGYPRLFPTDYADVVDNCRPSRGAVFGFSRREVERLNTAAAHLDTQLRSAARRAQVSYVSTLDALHGHELCTARSWVRPINATCASLIGDTLCGHPWERTSAPVKHGQQRIANVVSRVTAEPDELIGRRLTSGQPPKPGWSSRGGSVLSNNNNLWMSVWETGEQRFVFLTERLVGRLPDGRARFQVLDTTITRSRMGRNGYWAAPSECSHGGTALNVFGVAAGPDPYDNPAVQLWSWTTTSGRISPYPVEGVTCWTGNAD